MRTASWTRFGLWVGSGQEGGAGRHSLSNDQYQSKSQQKKLLRVAIIKAKVNAIHTEGSCVETKPIDGLISFPPINPNRVIVPHYDALVLTLCINGFDVHRVLVDPGSASDLL